MKHFALAGCLCCLSSLSACGTRDKECQQFIGMVNQTLREIDARPQPAADDLAAAAKHRKALAEKYRVLSRDVSRLTLSEPELIAYAKRYSGLADAAGAALAEGVKAIDAQDPEAARASQRRFDEVAKQEAALVQEINQLCLGEP